MYSNIKLKHLKTFLDDIDDFEEGEKEKWKLEQHKTPVDIAAQLLQLVGQRHQVRGSWVCDLGVGTGIFLSGLLFMGAAYGMGYEIDSKYIGKTQQMLEEKLENPCYDIVKADLSQPMSLRTVPFDIVITNPPFGTKQAGIDMKFLDFARRICHGHIYSFHKTATRDYVKKRAADWELSFEVVKTVQFPLIKRFNGYHRKDVAYTEVDIIHLAPL